MSLSEYSTFILSIIGVIMAVVSAALSYCFTKKHQINTEERKLKEQYYTDFIRAVSSVVVDANSKSKDDLAQMQNRLLLIASSEVINNLMIFHDYIKPESISTNGFDGQLHDELLTVLIKSMRYDLFKNKRINKSYPIIHLTGRSK